MKHIRLEKNPPSYVVVLDVGENFTRFPSGEREGPHCGQALGLKIKEQLDQQGDPLTVNLNGCLGFSSAFLKGLMLIINHLRPHELERLNWMIRDKTIILEMKKYSIHSLKFLH